jgi:hypothetical protein
MTRQQSRALGRPSGGATVTQWLRFLSLFDGSCVNVSARGP